MKKYYLSMLLSLAALPVVAQWQWPVKGTKAGEGIVYRPQDRIEKELNFGDLYIAAPEGTEVVSPADGTIANLSIDALATLTQVTTYGNDGGTFDKSRAIVVKKEKTPIPMKYVMPFTWHSS